MSAQPAESNYVPSPSPRIPFQRQGEVISFPERRSDDREAPPLPESNQDETSQTGTPDSDANSGTRITVRDVPGDWASVTAVWTGSPEPLCELTEQVTSARDGGDAQTIAMACWALIVLIPRGLLHLASWVLAHPLRLLAVAALAAIAIATS